MYRTFFISCPETKNPLTLEAHKVKSEFFTSQVLLEIGNHLVSHYFLLTNEDLLMWEEDPEGFGMLFWNLLYIKPFQVT